MLRAILLTALAAPGAALLLAGSAPKPFITGPAATSRARPIVAVSSLENTEQPEFITTLTDVGITALRLGTCALDRGALPALEALSLNRIQASAAAKAGVTEALARSRAAVPT